MTRKRPKWPTRIAPPKAEPTPIAPQPPSEETLLYKGKAPRLKGRSSRGTGGIDPDWDK